MDYFIVRKTNAVVKTENFRVNMSAVRKGRHEETNTLLDEEYDGGSIL